MITGHKLANMLAECVWYHCVEVGGREEMVRKVVSGDRAIRYSLQDCFSERADSISRQIFKVSSRKHHQHQNCWC